MFCFKRRGRRLSATAPSPAAVCPEQTQPCRGFLTDNQPQYQPNPPTSPSQYSNDQVLQQQQPITTLHSHSVQDLPCPISFYPNNVYGQGLDSDWGSRVDARLNAALDGPDYYNPIRNPTIPLPPGVVVVQVFQPSAPPLSPPLRPQPQSLPVYPRLPPLDQNYADQQMAVQKY